MFRSGPPAPNKENEEMQTGYVGVIAQRECCEVPCLQCNKCGSHVLFTGALEPGWQELTCDNDECKARLRGFWDAPTQVQSMTKHELMCLAAIRALNRAGEILPENATADDIRTGIERLHQKARVADARKELAVLRACDDAFSDILDGNCVRDRATKARTLLAPLLTTPTG
jgi:hypothetical protein